MNEQKKKAVVDPLAVKLDGSMTAGQKVILSFFQIIANTPAKERAGITNHVKQEQL